MLTACGSIETEPKSNLPVVRYSIIFDTPLQKAGPSEYRLSVSVWLTLYRAIIVIKISIIKD